MPIKYKDKDWLYQEEHPQGPVYFIVKEGNKYLVCKQFFNSAGEHHDGVIKFDRKDQAIDWIKEKTGNY